MNKKFLICSVVAMGLLLTACVKKEAPKEDEQVEVESSESVVLQPLEKTTENDSEPQIVQIERSETQYTSTEITRSAQPTEETEISVTAVQEPTVTPKAQTATTTTTESPKPTANRAKETQSEDDAVAAAIAAATPALDK